MGRLRILTEFELTHNLHHFNMSDQGGLMFQHRSAKLHPPVASALLCCFSGGFLYLLCTFWTVYLRSFDLAVAAQTFVIECNYGVSAPFQF